MSDDVTPGLAGDDPILRVRDLTIEFATETGPVTVVQDVGLELRQGETVALVGESGSGKTVTGLSIMGLLPSNARVLRGSVEFDGQDLLAEPASVVRSLRGRELGMIFQEPRRCLDPCFTIGDQVAEVIRAHSRGSRREAFARAVELLDRVQIPDAKRRARDYPHQFSGGQCQRVMLAIALACRPRVLIADEPTTALDVTVQSEMFDLLTELQSQMDLAVLLVTHDLGVVAETCDRVAVMYAGQIVEQATTRELFASPRHPYSRGLLGSLVPATAGRRLRSIRGVVPPSHDWPSGCRFNPRCDFVVPQCRTEEPVLVALGDRRVARCLRTDELDLLGVTDDASRR